MSRRQVIIELMKGSDGFARLNQMKLLDAETGDVIPKIRSVEMISVDLDHAIIRVEAYVNTEGRLLEESEKLCAQPSGPPLLDHFYFDVAAVKIRDFSEDG